jgi:ribonuclease P protein component
MPKFRLATIKKQKRFQEVFTNGKKFSTSNLFIVIDDFSSTDNNTIEYAVIVSKKVSKRAVVRNRVKRLLRECLRHYVHLLLGDRMQVKAILLYWRTPVRHAKMIRLSDVIVEFIKLVEKINRVKQIKHLDEENIDNTD